MDPASDPSSGRLNREAPWDAFDPLAYSEHNYRALRQDDRQIIEIVRDHFAAHFHGRRPDQPVTGVDVGAGANLYPALAMLPWCREITMFERSAANVAWLRRQVVGYEPNWDEFWDLLLHGDGYAAVSDPRAALREAATVQAGDLFRLPSRQWGMGTMFFVAESMSTSHLEFRKAVNSFAEALEPGSPFAAAFMENSEGYQVGDHWFPACAVTRDDIEATLAPYSEDMKIVRIAPPEGDAVREGYTGMIVACGRRGAV
ncbi:SCO2525 family SAM-dependent methyltransferase [Streptomyces sp. NPDC020917]|uniref:SCO2525 family SAM-dependent methyltransferase n=1 Tax=Streptomyces sp. NPDC020917 TaxID=3365102 RepID=UPI0037942FBB